MREDWPYILFWIFTSIFLVLFAWKVFGSSPTMTALYGGLGAALFMGAIDLYRRVGSLESDVRTIKEEVRVIQTDLSDVKKDISELKSEVNGIKKDISYMKKDISWIKKNLVTSS